MMTPRIEELRLRCYECVGLMKLAFMWIMFCAAMLGILFTMNWQHRSPCSSDASVRPRIIWSRL